MKKLIVVPSLVLCLVSLCPRSCFAQSNDGNIPVEAISSLAEPGSAEPAAPAQAAAAEENSGLSRFGVGVQLSAIVGPGVEVAYEVTQRINVRGGFNYFSYTTNFSDSGVSYGAGLKFESGEALADLFLWRSFHVSGGALFSNGSLVNASLSVPAGQTFTLSGTSYTSGSGGLSGTGALKFNTVAPEILFGVGNLVPRGRHRWSMKFEVGGAFRGSPTVALNFVGNVCSGGSCGNAANNSAFQSSVAAQQSKFDSDISFFKFYPVLSVGFGFRL